MASSRYRPRPRELRRLVALVLGFILLAGSLPSCTAAEAVSNVRALGDRQVDHARVVLDERAYTYDRAREIRRQKCRAWEDEADRLRLGCQGTDCMPGIIEAYSAAEQCWEDAEPPITDIVRYANDLREAKEALRGELR